MFSQNKGLCQKPKKKIVSTVKALSLHRALSDFVFRLHCQLLYHTYIPQYIHHVPALLTAPKLLTMITQPLMSPHALTAITDSFKEQHRNATH